MDKNTTDDVLASLEQACRTAERRIDTAREALEEASQEHAKMAREYLHRRWVKPGDVVRAKRRRLGADAVWRDAIVREVVLTSKLDTENPPWLYASWRNKNGQWSKKRMTLFHTDWRLPADSDEEA